MRVTTRAIGDIPGCKPVGHSPSLLELAGIGLAPTADQYCEAIRRYILDRDHPDHIDEMRMWSIMSMRRVI